MLVRRVLRLLVAGLLLTLPGAPPLSAARSARPLPEPWLAYNEAPATRTLHPESARVLTGSATDPSAFISGGVTALSGEGSAIVVDFGKDVAGWVSLRFGARSEAGQRVGLAFSESSLYVGPNSDATNGSGSASVLGSNETSTDGALTADVVPGGGYVVPTNKVRLAFRYLTLFMQSSGTVDLTGISLDFSAVPTMAHPDAYANYFWSNDSLLDRIWYAGAYTVQLDTIPPNHGRVWPPLKSGWDNGARIAPGRTVLAGGAKRDGAIWSGDMAISDPTEYVSTGNMIPTRNALTSLYDVEKPDGELPWAGPAIDIFDSDTYHTWTLVETANYYADTLDTAWVRSIWPRYLKAMAWITAKIDRNGLLDVTEAADWARKDQGGENLEANAILYRALILGASLASATGHASEAPRWRREATRIKAAVNRLLWDRAAGAYKDNPEATLIPQDGNSLAIWFGLVDDPEEKQSILRHLRHNWNSFGAVTPELSSASQGAISPYAGSMEVMARFVAGDAESALELIRREWGYMLEAPFGTGSTFWEGESAQGTLIYGGSYESLAHGWSTGPTAALTLYVAGLQPGAGGGRRYTVAPEPGDLRQVRASLRMSPGRRVTDSWQRTRTGFDLDVDSTGDPGSLGSFAVPTFGKSVTVRVNGKVVKPTRTDAAYVYLSAMPAGRYLISTTAR